MELADKDLYLRALRRILDKDDSGQALSMGDLQIAVRALGYLVTTPCAHTRGFYRRGNDGAHRCDACAETTRQLDKVERDDG